MTTRFIARAALAATIVTLTGCADDGVDGMPGMDGMDGRPGAPGTDGMDGTDGTDGTDGRDGAGSGGVMLERLGRYTTGVFDEGAAEIVAYDPDTERLFVVNANSATVDVLDIADPTMPSLVGTIDATAAASGRTLGAANSVAVSGGIAAVAIEADPVTDNGVVALYDTGDLSALGVVEVGALPDMVVFTPDGDTLLVANEGEADGTDPEGSIALLDVTGDLTATTATIAGFAAFEAMRADLEAQGLRVIGQGAGATTLAQDLEPEYITVSEDSETAWVSLQEANAIAVVDIPGGAVVDIIPLGFKNHAIPGNELDASDRDDRINIRNWFVYGMYQPDAIASFMVRGRSYVISANEGDSRGFEQVRVEDVTLDPTAFPDAATLQTDEALGRLEISLANGDTDDDGDYDALYAHGARSFSIWDGVSGRLVYDSGADFEVLTARRFGMDFNNDNDENGGDSRSDAKGPEPEAVAVGRVGQGLFAFIGLERMGGIMVYEITNPQSPRFVHYTLGRELIDFDGDVASELDAAGDLGPEGLVFIDASVSPTGEPLLAVANEISGSTTIYRVAEL